MNHGKGQVVVVGGGVIGLSIGFALAREGIPVVVIDANEFGRAASWAGAGILSPAATGTSNHPAAGLRSLSARIYPEWSVFLRELSGIDNGYRRCGGVDVAATLEEARELDDLSKRWMVEGIRHERLMPADFRRIEPTLHPDLVAGYFLPDRAQVRNPRHLKALVSALDRLGADLRPGLAAEAFRVERSRVLAVETSAGSIAADSVVIAAGPWSGAILRNLGVDLHTPPVKGEIALLQVGPDEGPSRIIEHGSRYLVPRGDGHILVGATEEDAGFDARSTAGGVRSLLEEASRLCPSLASAEFVRAWAGLRPGNADGLPTIGRPTDLENVIVATGHRRAGLQLSTGTAALVADLILGLEPAIDPRPFAPDRPIGRVVGGDAFRS